MVACRCSEFYSRNCFDSGDRLLGVDVTLKGTLKKNKSRQLEILGFCNNEFVIRNENGAFVSGKMTKMENPSGVTCCRQWHVSSDVSTV